MKLRFRAAMDRNRIFSGSAVEPITMGAAFEALFSCSVLYLPAKSRFRSLSVATLAYLMSLFIDAFGSWIASRQYSVGWLLLVSATSWTLFWHSFELLLVSKVDAADMELMETKNVPSGLLRGLGPWVRLHLRAASLLCNWRRIGTKWQIRDVPKFAPDGAVPSRTTYTIRSLALVIGCYVVM